MALWGADAPFHSFVSLKAFLPHGFLGVWWPEQLLGSPGQPIQPLPHGLLIWLLPEPWTQVGVYMADLFLTVLAGYVFLRGRGIRQSVAFLAGTGLAFSGYNATLISAGHLGNFGMTPFAVFTFACLDAAISHRSLFKYALAGACAGLGFSYASDVMLLYGLLAGTYAIFRWVCAWPRNRSEIWAHVGNGLAGSVIALAVFLAVGGSSALYAMKEAVPGRQELVKESSADAYEFATNWSLPPEEMAEFVVPCIYGTETGDPSAPYWGRLGRSLKWPAVPGSIANLRQHTVYLGIIPLALAFFAAMTAWRGRMRHDISDSKSSEDISGSPRSEIVFWSLAWLASLILALGRYTPLYRLFFALPYCSTIRCPVKFLHLTEFATSVLFGWGLELFLRAASGVAQEHEPVSTPSTEQRTRRFEIWIMCGLVGVAGVAFVFAAAIVPSLSSWDSVWKDLGLAAQADVLRTNMRMAFSHAAFMALALAAWIAATAIMSRRHSRLTGLAVIALGLLLAWDIHAVMRRYLHPFDPQAMYRGDEIVDALAADPEPFRVSCPVVRGDPVSRHWMDFAFPYRRFENFDPFMPMSVLPVWLRDYVGALGDNPLRIWQLASVRYVAGPAQALRSLTNHPAFLPVAGISVSGNGGMFQAPSQASHILLLNRAALPRAAVFYQWEEVKGEDVWARLADPAWNPWTSVLVEGIPSGGEGERKETAVPVQIAERSWRKIKLAADVRREGILLLNDKFDSSWKAFVDGAAAPILLCNGVMRGVRVPPGRHEIEFRFRSPYRNTAILSYGVLGFLMVWAAGRQAWRKSVKRRPEVG